jgi:hypothetical protein
MPARNHGARLQDIFPIQLQLFGGDVELFGRVLVLQSDLGLGLCEGRRFGRRGLAFGEIGFSGGFGWFFEFQDFGAVKNPRYRSQSSTRLGG